MDSYEAGSNGSIISLSVHVRTFGLAATRCVLRRINNGPVLQDITSQDASGNIHNREIGAADACRGSMLIIATHVSMAILDPEEQLTEQERLSIAYTLSGGIAARVTFNEPDEKVVSADSSVMVLRKKIMFT